MLRRLRVIHVRDFALVDPMDRSSFLNALRLVSCPLVTTGDISYVSSMGLNRPHEVSEYLIRPYYTLSDLDVDIWGPQYTLVDLGPFWT